MEDDDEEGGDDEVVGADGPTTPEHDYPGHRSVTPPESLRFPHCCCNKLERGGNRAGLEMDGESDLREGGAAS